MLDRIIATSTVAVCLTFVLLVPAVLAAPTVPTEIQQPGTQPNEVPNYTSPDNCQGCHGNTTNPAFEPSFGWRGSMMAHSSRDPLFWATLAVAEQDFLPNADPNLRGGVGDLCMRCHLPNGWLQGRSTPTDGSAMNPALDANGVECEHCHKLVDPDQPVNIPGTVEEQNAPFLAHDASSGEAYRGTGMYVINNESSRLGPYSDPATPHAWRASSFHRQSELCGTCHDVSNPAVGDLAHNNGAQVPLTSGKFSGVIGAPVTQKAAFKNPPQHYGVVERTFSEWKASAFPTRLVDDYNTLPGDLKVAGGILETVYNRAYDSIRMTANYEDGEQRYFTCQSCHMSPSTGVGCRQGGVPVRTDLPRHDLTGAGHWAPDAILYQEDNGLLRFGSGLTTLQRDALTAGKARAEQTLQGAAALTGSQAGANLSVRVTNLTGHKLITGYPEGRRMWLNVKFFDAGSALIEEIGGYGPIGRNVNDLAGNPHAVESLFDPSGTIVYEAGAGIDQEWAAQLLAFGLDSGVVVSYDRMTDAIDETLGSLAIEPPGTMAHSLHFVLNNVLIEDRRIPPYGFRYDDAQAANALPVPATQYGNPGPGGVYDHFDDVAFPIPVGAVTAEVRLFYQQTSWEYIQFLWLQNDGQNAFLANEGVNLLDTWLNTGMSAPVEMDMTSFALGPLPGAPGEASEPALPTRQMTAAFNLGTGEVEIEFDAACDANQHTIYYGDLADVSSYGYGGAVCAVGGLGVAAFDPGVGSVFFVVAGNNGSAEGSYGRDGAGNERPEDLGTLGCDIPQDLAGSCSP